MIAHGVYMAGPHPDVKPARPHRPAKHLPGATLAWERIRNGSVIYAVDSYPRTVARDVVTWRGDNS